MHGCGAGHKAHFRNAGLLEDQLGSGCGQYALVYRVQAELVIVRVIHDARRRGYLGCGNCWRTGAHRVWYAWTWT